MMTLRFGPEQAKRTVVALLVGFGLLVSYPVETAKKFSEWGAPTNLSPQVNSPFEELLPHISKDGLSLYFASNRPGGFGDFDIWVSQRVTPEDEWGPPMNLRSNVNSIFNDRAPALSRDSHLLFFSTSRPGGFGLLDIWVSSRKDTHDDFAWQPPVNLGAGVNGAANDFGPSFLENDDIGIPSLFFGSNRPGGAGSFDVYISDVLGNGTFGPASLITELSTPHNDFRPTIRPDGLELIFDSNRPGPLGVVGIGLRDLWVSMRATVSEPWSTPENVWT